VLTLQAGEGPIPGATYLESRPDDVSWGWLPNAASRPVATVRSGDTLTVDTVSHEGVLDDQGRDPVRFFGRHGVSRGDVLDDAREIAATLPRLPGAGPHVVTGPVLVPGARPGDLLKVDTLDLRLRAAYGVISNRHGAGALPGEFPETPPPEDGAGPDRPELFHNVSIFTPVEQVAGRSFAVLGRTGHTPVRFPLHPFMGLLAVAPATSDPVLSIPPGPYAGNIDVKHLVCGTSLYIPVQVDGALFSAGDPHYAQGNGEVALTALEAPLRATFRLSVIPQAEARSLLGALAEPFVETDSEWIVIGLHADLAEAMKAAVRSAVTFLETAQGMDRAVAYAYLSAAADFEVTQVVDRVKGVHCRIRKQDFRTWV
jgi:acetamidase/formamidase